MHTTAFTFIIIENGYITFLYCVMGIVAEGRSRK